MAYVKSWKDFKNFNIDFEFEEGHPERERERVSERERERERERDREKKCVCACAREREGGINCEDMYWEWPLKLHQQQLRNHVFVKTERNWNLVTKFQREKKIENVKKLRIIIFHFSLKSEADYVTRKLENTLTHNDAFIVLKNLDAFLKTKNWHTFHRFPLLQIRTKYLRTHFLENFDKFLRQSEVKVLTMVNISKGSTLLFVYA